MYGGGLEIDVHMGEAVCVWVKMSVWVKMCEWMCTCKVLALGCS